MSTNQSLTVGDFMTALPDTINAELRVSDALDRMYNDNLRHLPVVNDDGGLVGMITTRDVALSSSLYGRDPEETPVSEIMTRRPFSVSKETPLDEVALIMERDRLGSTIVTDGVKPVGIFTTTDGMRAIRQLMAGAPVEPAVKPHLKPGEDEDDGPRQTHGHRRPRGTSKYDGMVSWFLAKV